MCAIFILSLTGIGKASALTINLSYDPDSTFAEAGLSVADISNMKTACSYAVSQFANNFNDNVNVNIKVTAVAGTAVFGQSYNVPALSATYGEIRAAAIADSPSVDDAAALGSGGSLPAIDPIGGSHSYLLTKAQAKALGLVADDSTYDGTFIFGGGYLYSYDPLHRAVLGRYDFIGIAMHEFSEIMGRLPLMGRTDLFGNPGYTLMDLFHYTGVGVRGLNNGPNRFFSINNGTALLNAFNDASVHGGDLQDWASGANDSFNAFSSPGVQNDLTPVDLRVMDVIGYDATTRTLTVASSNPSGGVSVTVSPSDNNGASDGTTQFTRTYNSGTQVDLTAPLSAGGNAFQKWQRDGSDWDTSTSTSMTMDANHTMTAVYSGIQPPTAQLVSPSAGAAITFPQTFSWSLSDNSPTRLYFTNNPSAILYVYMVPTFSGSGSYEITPDAWSSIVDLLNAQTTHTFYWTVGPANIIGNQAATTYANWRPFGLRTLRAAGDFDADGKADILWQNTAGQCSILLMNGTVPKRSVPLPPVANSWNIVGAGDFDGDHKTDILWQNTSGARAIWLMNGTTVKRSIPLLPPAAISWNIVGAGDFDRDHKMDILWQDTSGARVVWLMNGTTLKQSVALVPPAPRSWNIVGAGNFDGDGKADIVWQNTSGACAIWLMNGVTLKQSIPLPPVASSWNIVGAADFDGDGKTDILWQKTSGESAVWLMNGTTLRQSIGFGILGP